MVPLAEPSRHTEKILTGINVNGCARTVQAVVAVVVETVDAVKMLEKYPRAHIMDGIKDTVPVLVAVAFVPLDIPMVKWIGKRISEIFHLMLCPITHGIAVEFFGRISLG